MNVTSTIDENIEGIIDNIAVFVCVYLLEFHRVIMSQGVPLAFQAGVRLQIVLGLC